MADRAYSLLEIKAVDDEQRVIEGIASTPSTDRMEDIVESMGAEYKLPIPFLWQHESRESPIGNVVAANPTKDGIPVRIEIASDDEPGPLQDRLNYAWRSIKKGLVRGLSIGFRGLESEPIENSWGVRFKRWEWLELSAVTVPANAEASIQTIKSIDADFRAATGNKETTATKSAPGASGRTVRIPKHKTTEATMYGGRIKDLENTRGTKLARIQAIEEEAAGAGRTKDAAEQEEFDELAQDIEAINKAIGDLQRAQKLADLSKPVSMESGTKEAGESRTISTVRTSDRLEKGQRFARVVRSLYLSHKQHRDVEMVARQLYPDDSLTQKAAVAAGSTTGDTWGHQLVGDETSVFADFVEFLRPMTILGRFGSGGIPSLRNVPFRTPLIGQTEGGDGYWVGEGQPKPLTKMAFNRRTLDPLKVANIAVVTKELLQYASPSADTLLRDQLAAALRERLDRDFVDITKTAVAGVSPASITNAAPSIGAESPWTDADDVRLDVRSVFQQFINANNPPTTGVWIMSSSNALALSLLVNALGQPEFSGIGMNGGNFFGLPVITSEYVGDIVILANASDIYLGDEGGISVDVSTEASLSMHDADTVAGNSITPTAQQLVSMFQTNSVAFLAEREINWMTRRDSGVVVLTDVAWGGAVNES